jgi:hypothetical protein
MDMSTLSDLRPQFEMLAQAPFDLQAVCIVAATEEVRDRRATSQKRDNLAGSEKFRTSDGRVVEIVLCGIPGDGMRFALLAEKAERCVGRGEPWLWTVFTLAGQCEPGSPLWAGKFQDGRLLAESTFPYYESALPTNVAKASVYAIDLLRDKRGSELSIHTKGDHRSPSMSLSQFALALGTDARNFKKQAEAEWVSLARTSSGGAIENRGLDTQGLVAVRVGICAGHGRDCCVEQSDSNHSARNSHRRGPSQSPKDPSSQAARRYL